MQKKKIEKTFFCELHQKDIVLFENGIFQFS